jgi:HSP20 family protein
MSVAAVDVCEEKNSLVVKAELPGLERSDIEVHLRESTLMIGGEKKKDKEVRERDYYRAERSHGTFSRTIALLVEVDTAKAKATFKNGVLGVRLPKRGALASKFKKVPIV